MPFIDANGLELYYEMAGVGPRLLFISGTGGDLRKPPKLTEGPVANVFEVLAYDQRGLGQSEVPPGPYSMAQYADDAAALLDALDWDDCAVLGASFGGMVAQELAIRHPGRVRRLVLACTSSGGQGGASYPLHELAALDVEERIIRHFEIADTRWDATWRAAHPDQVGLMSALFRQAPAEVPEGQPNGPLLQLEARSHHEPPRGSARSAARRWSVRADSTASRRRPTVRFWPSASPVPNWPCSMVAISSWSRTQRRCRP